MIIIKFNFFLIFRPILNNLFKVNNYQIFCKFFFFILLFFEYYFNEFFFFFLLNKKSKRINSFLKAPHHYKKAQTKIVKFFFFLKLFFKILVKIPFSCILDYFCITSSVNMSSSNIYLTNMHVFFYIRNYLIN